MAEQTVNRFFIFQNSMRLAARQNSRYNLRPMITSNTLITGKRKDRPALLILCLLFSVLLHLLVVFSLPYEKLSKRELALQNQEPTIVRLIDKPASVEKKEIELDQRPVKPTPEPPPKSSRLAEENQRVETEMAPKGEDFRDLTARPAPPKPVTPVPERTTGSTKQQQSQPQSSPVKQAETQLRPVDPKGKLPTQRVTSLPPLQQLTQLAPDTVRRIASSERAAQERIKQRDDIDAGDTVWLNLERGLLISFFRRFRNQIEGVWNYPREAIVNEMQGTLLLKITVDTEGELLDVDLLRSSGHEILDYEAIQAVYRAAPFGPLGKHYPHPDLKIMAHFRYQISGKYIYGK